MEIQGQAQVAVAVAMLNKRHPKMLVKEGILYLAVSASNATIETLKKREKIPQMAEEKRNVSWDLKVQQTQHAFKRLKQIKGW
jgi:hypothetical protein